MKKANRVTDNKDFGACVKQGRAYKSPSFTIHVLKTDREITRVGVSASVKLGCAVVRNRLKRQVRAMADSVVDYSKPNLDIVIVVRKAFLDKNFQDNLDEFKELISKMEAHQ